MATCGNSTENVRLLVLTCLSISPSAVTRPFFAKERVTDFGIFERKALLALNRMQERFVQGQAIDVQDICSRFTLDAACEFLVGTPIYSLRDPLPLPPQNQYPAGTEAPAFDTSSNRFAKAFADAQTSLARRARLGVLWPLFETFKDRTSDDMRVVRGLIEPIVRQRMENGSGDKQDSLLDHLLGVSQGASISQSFGQTTEWPTPRHEIDR